jgi:hypothetical protein
MKSVQTAIIGMGILGVVIVLLSIILVKMKDTSGVTTALNTSIDTTVTAIATPVSYFALIVLVIVFVFLLGFLIKKLTGAGKQE